MSGILPPPISVMFMAHIPLIIPQPGNLVCVQPEKWKVFRIKKKNHIMMSALQMKKLRHGQ